MKTAVIVFPGSNCDRDLAVALGAATGTAAKMVWHKETTLPDGLDLIGVPGGFSFGDYLRCGAIAAQSPIMSAVVDFAARGGRVIGICNGFQVLIEAGLLPGALMRNRSLKFVCRSVKLTVASADTPLTTGMTVGTVVDLPVAHHDGAYVADDATLAALNDADRVAFRYADGDNPNGSMEDIAGIVSPNRRVLGMMPHPERAADPVVGKMDGARLFERMMAETV